MKSEPRSQALDVHKLYKEGLADEEILKEIARHSYDKMALELTEMQVWILTLFIYSVFLIVCSIFSMGFGIR